MKPQNEWSRDNAQRIFAARSQGLVIGNCIRRISAFGFYHQIQARTFK
jgi:hypothetical protein